MLSENKTIREYKLSKAREFIELFLDDDSIFKPTHLFDTTETTTNGFIFRGQSNIEWPLLPTAHRAGNPLDNYTPQPPFQFLTAT